jgi:tetratricopeptide (TPR) repeat protein
LATCLSRSGQHQQAASLFEESIARGDCDANLYGNAASARLLQGDVQRALHLCGAGVALAPDNQACLALTGTAYRLLDDERDEELNRYDSLIHVIDLEPPFGFADMATFNAELDTYLDRLHPHTREHIAQSLRGGSQTVEEVFASGHRLIDLLQQRIDDAMKRYIEALPRDETHPFLSRRKSAFAYNGSWSSRLQDKGFHANHLHPAGWISSCYYVAVPDAAGDEEAREGWIKFGEPDIQVPLAQPVRRAIQPAPGRLVLFPSYMWHGTIAFRSNQARTTIAFDAIPV